MSHIDEGHGGNRRGETPLTVDALMIVCCIPVVAIAGIVTLIAGGLDLAFLVPAVVCGAMVGMLMFVSIRDRTTI